MITQIKNLNPLLTNNPKKLCSSNLFKARVLKIASVINLICIIVFTLYLFNFIGISTSVLPIANMAIGIAIPILCVSITIFNNLSASFYKTADFYKKILSELNELKSENESQIKNYLNKIKCPNVKDIKIILIALAHFRVWNSLKDSALNEIEEIRNINNTNDQNFKYKMHKLALNIYEKEVLYSKLKLAQIHHIINNPTDQKSLKNFGTISSSNKKTSLIQNDNYYFIFHDYLQKQKKGLTFLDVDRMDIENLSKSIYN
jgi:hypothetical protein